LLAAPVAGGKAKTKPVGGGEGFLRELLSKRGGGTGEDFQQSALRGTRGLERSLDPFPEKTGDMAVSPTRWETANRGPPFPENCQREEK